MKITIVNPNLSGCPSILEIGLTYLATYINERSKHEAVTLDFTFHSKDWKKHLRKHMEEQRPDAIGFGTPAMYLDYIKMIIDEIQKIDAGISIVCGGYHPTLKPYETFQASPHISAVVLGDGEETLKEYLDALQNQKSLDGIKGLYYTDEDYEIHKNPLRPKMDISKLPFPNYDVWEDLDKYFFFLNQLYTIGMRGCPFNCTNCSDQPFHTATPGNRVRILEPKQYIAEIKHQVEKYPGKFDIVHCYDPTFTFDYKWVKKFCDEWKKAELNKKLAFSVFARGDTLGKKMVKTLADANCRVIRIGTEVGNEKIRIEMLHKVVTNREIEDNVKLLHDHKIAITAFNMLGCPGEVKKDLQMTFDFLKKLEIDRPVFFIFRPIAGTEAAGMMGGSNVDSKKMNKITSLHKGAVLSLKDMTQKQIEKFQLKCYLYFASKRAWRLIKITKHRFFIDWIKYFIKGIRSQVPMFYMVGYFMYNYGENGVN